MPVLKGVELASAVRTAYDDAQSTIWFSTNKPAPWVAAMAGGFAFGGLLGVAYGAAGMAGVTEALGRSNDVADGAATKLKTIRMIAANAKGRHIGNCGDYTALAFEHLRNKNILPIDFMNVVNGDHQFLVVGRPSGSNPENAATWGLKDVWIIDGWKKLCFEMGEMKFPSVVGNKKYESYARLG